MPTLRTLVHADVTRFFGGYSRARLLRAVLLERTYRVVLTLRLCQAAPNPPLRLVAVALHRLASGSASVDLPWKTRIGPGFRLFHGWGAVVNTDAVIGANVSLFHGVTLGQGDRIAADGSRTTGFPVIEDEVWIGPQAIVAGAVTIGRGARIAGGAVVTRDVAPGTMVAGNPAVVVRSDVPADVLYPAGVHS